jgi:hypothetical protein
MNERIDKLTAELKKLNGSQGPKLGSRKRRK